MDMDKAKRSFNIEKGYKDVGGGGGGGGEVAEVLRVCFGALKNR